MPKSQEFPVVVTTEFRGVFFGYSATGKAGADDRIALLRCRNAVYWSSDVRGVFGLAVTGPTKGCRIGPVVPSITLNKVTSVMGASDEAVAAWESAKWSA